MERTKIIRIIVARAAVGDDRTVQFLQTANGITDEEMRQYLQGTWIVRPRS